MQGDQNKEVHQDCIVGADKEGRISSSIRVQQTRTVWTESVLFAGMVRTGDAPLEERMQLLRGNRSGWSRPEVTLRAGSICDLNLIQAVMGGRW